MTREVTGSVKDVRLLLCPMFGGNGGFRSCALEICGERRLDELLQPVATEKEFVVAATDVLHVTTVGGIGIEMERGGRFSF